MIFMKKIDFEKTAEMLDENQFWKLIDESLQNTDTQGDQEKYLIGKIEKLTPKEIIGFRLRTDKLLFDSYTSKLWCAAYIINGGCSDDGFEYFRNWLISRGQNIYYKVLKNPDDLVEITDEEDIEFESFWYVALVAFKNCTGKELYDYIDNEKFKTKEGEYPQIDIMWSDDDGDSMKKICPRLYEKYIEN